MSYLANKTWRMYNPSKRYAGKARNYGQGRKHARQKRAPWTKEDDSLVLNFAGTDAELAEKIGRSVQAIQVQRSKLKHRQS